MALLSQNKRKEKYGFDPRNTNWANDDNKFGKKLMEKMGWEKGKGLGANEDGMTEHIKASYKADTKGLGCTPKEADAWIAHQDEFNDLLKKLNGETTVEPEEGKSKRFYGRFARGRVQTLRSTEDLDCILGRRKTSEPSTPASQSAANSDDESRKEEGLKTITSSCSVQEYFSQKMKAMKSRNAANAYSDENSEESLKTNVCSATGKDDEKEDKIKPVYGAVQFSYGDEETSPKVNGSGATLWNDDTLTVNETSEGNTKDREKKKKKKRKAKDEEENCILESNEQIENVQSKKKKIKLGDEFCDKSQTDMNDRLSLKNTETDEVGVSDDEKCLKRKKAKGKKKKGENGQCEMSSQQENNSEVPDAESVPSLGNLRGENCLKKQKKTKKKRKQDIDDECNIPAESMRDVTETDGVNSDGILENGNGSEVKKAKSKKRRKDVESPNLQQEDDHNDDESDVKNKRKKRKKKRRLEEEEAEEECRPTTENVEKNSEKEKRKSDGGKGDQDESSERKKEKKKKKRKEARPQDLTETNVDVEPLETQNAAHESELKREKRKKKKRPDQDDERNAGGESESLGSVRKAHRDSGIGFKDSSLVSRGNVKESTDKVEQKTDLNKEDKDRIRPKEKEKRKKQRKALNEYFPGSNLGELNGYTPTSANQKEKSS